jgi:serine O-acetyltransferase
MQDFVRFLLKKTYRYRAVEAGAIDEQVTAALTNCIADVRYHYPDLTTADIIARIETNQNELPVFLYRLGRTLYESGDNPELMQALHWVLRECCACELYFSNAIAVGFYVWHGVGTVIGSRTTIGRGFRIYQDCTIGNKSSADRGRVLGDNVTLFAHSQILGDVNVGDNVTIGSHSLVLDDLPANSICYGIPAKAQRSQS